MVITHANQHLWMKNISFNALTNYGTSDQKRITKALLLLEENEITYEFSSANDLFFEWFTPLYTHSLQAKNSDRIHDIYSNTLGKSDSVLQHKTLTLYQSNKPIGGCIFSCWKDRYSISYRMFNPTWNTPSKIASPALLGEYLLDVFAYEHDKNILIHGQDRNPYGVFSAIGVANFKLAVGCNPKLPTTYEINVTETETVNQDTLIFHLPDSGRTISEATLILHNNDVSKYSQLFSYEDRLKINIINHN
jgi:hypothetical protein